MQLLYLAYLMKLFRMKDRDISPGFLAARSLQGCPQQVCDSLVSDFTEYATDGAGVVKYRMTPKLKDKLLAYICTLCLHLDEFSLELNSLAADLSLSMTKYVVQSL